MRFAFVSVEKVRYPVTTLCRLLEVSRSGFYASCGRSESGRSREDRKLLEEIRAGHTASRRTYGSPRVHRDLRERGVAGGRHRVARLMREAGLFSKRRRRYRVTTDSNHSHPLADNVLARDFTADGPNRKWAADITYVWTRSGWLYLAAVIDLYSRRVVGWAMSTRMTRQLALDALLMALAHRGQPEQLVHHSDQGSQYASRDYRRLLRSHGIECSMSRRGNCWDNAVVESFFATLKSELVHHADYQDPAEAKANIFEFIEVFYNRQRRHSTLGYVSPADFEQAALAA